MDAWPEPVERVAKVLRERAVEARIEEFSEGTPTARAAAEAVGCDRAQIVKSLVFVCDELPVLALVPGDRRADEHKVAQAAGARYARTANADEVLASTGFPPGGVAPFPAPGITRTFIDQSFLAQEIVWIGAGTEFHMAGLTPHDLVRVTQAEPADLGEA